MNNQGFSALEQLISNEYSNTTGLIISQNNKLIYEQYFNGITANDAVHIFSVTKSIFSLLIGIAIDKGYIKGVDQKVLDFFPNYIVPADEKTIQDITLKNILTMTAPYKFEDEPFEEFFMSENWINTALNYLGGTTNTQEFRYSPIIGAHILGGILTNATGQSILEFATKYLFAPLGIDNIHNTIFNSAQEQLDWYAQSTYDNAWVVDPQGINTASWGLTIPPNVMLKIGQLYLNKGIWNGKQLVSDKWINESTSMHSQWGELAYGYLWWILDETNTCYAAIGDGGNIIYVNTEQQLVIVMSGFFMPEVKDRIELIKAHIEPMLNNL